MYSVCKHKGPIQWDAENQYTGTKFTYKGPIIWAYGDTMHVQKNNPIGTRGTCVYKGPTLWGSMHKQRTNSMSTQCTYRRPMLWNNACSYTYLCTCEGFMSCKKHHLYGKPRPACTERSCYKECFGSNAVREWYRSSVHKPTQKCTQLNGINPVHVTKCGVRVRHHHQTVCHVRECYTIVYRFMYATIQACAQVHKAV